MADIEGLVTIDKLTLARDWLNVEPANRKSALLDLWTWANDRQRTIKLNGKSVTLKRGQLAYSMVTLAEKWRWGRQKVDRVLRELQDEGFITLETSNVTTIITVMDYTIYNNDTATEQATLQAAEQTTESAADQAADQAQKVEGRSRKVEGGRGPTEIPSESEVLEFAASWDGDQARGIPGVMPETWAMDWYSWRMEPRAGAFPSDWRGDMVRRFRTSWLNGDRRARKQASGAGSEKTGEKTAGESTAQKLFKLDVRLKELEAAIPAAEQMNNWDLYDQHVAEQKALQAARKQITEGA